MPSDNILTDEVWNRPNMAVGHYTQVVYESSYKLGCGIAVCSDMTLVVCQYSPPGNWGGEPIYTIGEPCKTDSDCQCDGCKCSSDEALCIKPN
uniref:SCP domain-containing protein n=1 Tax=Angiostrongylus cantonensis TaxID=6313 RepID=A0A0K0CYK8_ANGCA